ncbi:carbohydrate ABC transporter permease [bacterium C-53]|nr:carbohydrate ABC transporter permease [Lachnospiraceae bacterium]NBI01632.1 carbohydrate ABC transporter permease [Lachnospiraceae bacterium]RKJ12926.1 carbohydrate ABC transporter permease [bacterium C-53]
MKLFEGIEKGFCNVILGILCVIILIPVFLLITGSFMDSYELSDYLLPVFMGAGGMNGWRLMPDYPTFQNYKKLLFETPQFFVLFWNSMKIVCCILAGQLLVGVPGAWAFAVYRVRGAKSLFLLYEVLMLLPFQVMMMSNYLTLKRLSLLDSHAAVILPAVFSAFPVFLSYGGFRRIPIQLVEAARIDGAGEWAIFTKIGLPLGKSGLVSALVLGFLEYWNMIEQPMAFLSDKTLWPLSMFFPKITINQAGASFCASVIMLIPAVFVFLAGQDALEAGIIYSGLKE